MLKGTAEAVGKARKLRQEMSLPEVLLWRELRKRPAGLKFRRQHPAGPYILDFACMEARLAIEIDGEVHGTGEAVVHDEARDEWLANQGFRTMRVPAREVLNNLDGVVEMLALRADPAQPLHQPSAGPPPRAGEDLA